jgi:ribonuclease E
MKEALKNDRARIQVGRISSFGLMEMSRQRLRTGVLEASTKPCPHCEGSGLMRTASSAGLSALRMLEEEAARGRGSRIVLRAGREAAVYVLNRKRGEIGEVEERYGVTIEVHIEESFEGARMAVESFGPPPVARPRVEALAEPELDQDELVDEPDDEEEEEEDDEAREEPRRDSRPRDERESREEESDERGRKRRRRRGRRGGRRREHEDERLEEPEGADARQEVEAIPEAGTAQEGVPEPSPEPSPEPAAEDEQEKPRGRRRPRARRKDAKPTSEASVPEPTNEASVPEPTAGAEPEAPPTPEPAGDDPPPKPKRSRRRKAEPDAGVGPSEAASPEAAAEAAAPEAANDTASPAANEPTPAEAVDAAAEVEAGTARRGWWQRTFGA